VLGPLLFIIFFNDIIKDLTDTEVALYADDIAAWKASVNFQLIEKRLQGFLDHIKAWLSKWRVKLNTTKTVYTIITQTTGKTLNLNFNGTELKYSSSPKFLGITLDPQLRFKLYIEDIIIRTTRRLNMMRHLKGQNWGASKGLLLVVYKALIRSLIDYAPIIQILLGKCNKLRIARIQSRAARIITGLPNTTHKTDLNTALRLQSTEERAMLLSVDYINKAAKNSPVIAELVGAYFQQPGAIPIVEGQHSRCKPRPTILGTVHPHLNSNRPSST
jgi:hypothetical protein